MRKASLRGQTLLPLTCLAAFFLLFALINFTYLPRFIDGDIYADMELAREIWRKKSLFPDNWVYGNQYYTVATPVLAALFYGLTGSMNLSMALATTLMSGFILWSLWWMLRPFASRSGILAAILLFVACPMATDLLREPQGQLFFTLASYYACYLITLCLVFGDYARAALQPEKGFRPLPFLLGLALSFLTGMQSLRQTLIMVLPLLALEALRVLRRRAEGRTLLRALGCAAANALGYALMKLLKIPARTIYGQVELGGSALSQRLLGDWHALRGITGLDTALFDPPRAFYLLFFAVTVLLAPAAAMLLWKRRKEKSGLALLWMLCAVSLLGTLLAGLAVEIRMREIYLFLWAEPDPRTGGHGRAGQELGDRGAVPAESGKSGFQLRLFPAPGPGTGPRPGHRLLPGRRRSGDQLCLRRLADHPGSAGARRRKDHRRLLGRDHVPGAGHHQPSGHLSPGGQRKGPLCAGKMGPGEFRPVLP